MTYHKINNLFLQRSILDIFSLFDRRKNRAVTYIKFERVFFLIVAAKFAKDHVFYRKYSCPKWVRSPVNLGIVTTPKTFLFAKVLFEIKGWASKKRPCGLMNFVEHQMFFVSCYGYNISFSTTAIDEGKN